MSDLPTDTLNGRISRGLAWKATSTVVIQLTKIVAAILLARLLSPHDYGVAGMVVVFASLVLIFSDVALGAALIQRPTLTDADRSTVFWTSVAVGLALMLAGIAMSGPIAAFYGEPRVRMLFVAMSATFLVTALSSTQAALLTRDMHFRALELRQIGSGIASSAGGVTLAAIGLGPWAIIGQQLIAAVVSTVLLWLASPWRPSLRFSPASLRSFAGYSGNVLGSRLLFYANRNTDNLLIGRVLGASALGAYSVAYNLMLLPASNIATPVQDVLFPAFSRLQHDLAALRAGWLRANAVVAGLVAPLLAGLIVVAPDFVHVVLGARWSATSPVLQLLACVGILQSVQAMNSGVLRAVDRTDLLLRYSLIVVSGSLIAFVIGLRWGIVGVAAAYLLSSLAIEPYYSRLTAHSVGLRLRDFVRPLAGVAEAVAGMAVVVAVARQALVGAGMPAALRLVLLIATGIAVYLPLAAWRAPDVLGDVGRAVGRRRRMAAPATASA